MHALAPDDTRFRTDFEEGRIAPEAFDHRTHIRLAYVYLVDHDADVATQRMRDALQRFLHRHGIDAGKYHETLTRAWILAVRHFMARSEPAASAAAFIEANPLMLDSRIMMTHYSAERLFSSEARARFADPDLDPIPRHQP